MKRLPLTTLLVLLFFCCVCRVTAQDSTVITFPNLIPNPSFEEMQGYPIGWFYKGADFGALVKFWTSPTLASPDAYFPKTRVPDTWKQQGFGNMKPHEGQGMAGITVFGCTNGKPHCREYLQVQLREPLVVGQMYRCEMWVASLKRGIKTNNLGAYFGKKKLNLSNDDGLGYRPLVVADAVLSDNDWQLLSVDFKADSEADWCIIGNIFSDTETKTVQKNEQPLNFGYYYIDDLLLKKIEPILQAPIPDDDLTLTKLEVGKTVLLKNIYFDSDKSELLPRSEIELQKLLTLLQKNNNLQIQILGHTDNIGSNSYNLSLSRQRATQVMNFLLQNGITDTRISVEGKGSIQPLAPNDTEENRQMNRRVEFKILSF